MAAIMTKRGNADNILTYEFVCDSVADLAQLDPQYVTMGSTAIIIDGDAGFEIYMANGQKRWVNLGTGEVVAQPGDQEEEDNFDGGEDVLTGFWTQEEIDTYGPGVIVANNLNLSNHRISGKLPIRDYGSNEIVYIPVHMNTNLSYPTWNMADGSDEMQLCAIIKTNKNNYVGGELIAFDNENKHAEVVVIIIYATLFKQLNIDDSLSNATTLYFAKATTETMQTYYPFINEQEDMLAASNEFYQSLPIVATYDLSNLLMGNIIDIVLPDILYGFSEEQIEASSYPDYIKANQANIEINNHTITGTVVLHQNSSSEEIIHLSVGSPIVSAGIGISNLNMAGSLLYDKVPFFVCMLKTNQNNLIPINYADAVPIDTIGYIGIGLEFVNIYKNDSITNATELQFYRCDNVPEEAQVSLEAFATWLATQTPTVIYDISGIQFISELDFFAPVPKVGNGMDYLTALSNDTDQQRNITINNHTITGEVELYNYESDYVQIDFEPHDFDYLFITVGEQPTGILPVLKTSNNNLFIVDYVSRYDDYLSLGFNNEQVNDSFSNVTELQFYRIDTMPTNITSYEEGIAWIKTLPLVSVYDMSNVSFIDMENWENGGNDV